jgi:hypothetical protein
MPHPVKNITAGTKYVSHTTPASELWIQSGNERLRSHNVAEGCTDGVDASGWFALHWASRASLPQVVYVTIVLKRYRQPARRQ